MLFPKTPVRVLVVVLALFGAVAAARAQDAIIPPVPFPAAEAQPPSPGRTVATELAAQRALETGLSSIAAEIYQQLLNDPAQVSAPAARNRIVLALATALIVEDRMDDAARALQHYAGAPVPALALRQAMIDVRQGRFDQARAALAQMRAEDLPSGERGWLFFVRGMLAEHAREYDQARNFYQQAEAEVAAAQPAQQAWFRLANVRAKLFLGQTGDSLVAELRQRVERDAGRKAERDATVGMLAVAYNAAGRRGDAITLLQTQLQFLAPQETATRDEWLFLLGMIAGPADNVGRDALYKLLSDSDDRVKQRAALRLLANASREPSRAAEFQNRLNQLVAVAPPHPILPDLLLCRAQIALAAGDYLNAENNAKRLLAEFPGSQLRASARGVLTAVAWEQAFYRTAAGEATLARSELERLGLRSGAAYAQLGVLVAEAWYRARDFRSAADAYGSALQNVPAGIEPGMLMFQRVFAEIQTGDNGASLATAQKILDEYAADPRFDAVSRWQAEWNLARALQAAGETAQAYGRVNRLLGGAAPAGLPADLRARMAWLQAHLAYNSGNFAQAVAHAEKLKTSLADATPALRADIVSTAMLIEVEAGYALSQAGQTAGVDTADILKKLRADYSKTDAAIRSYIVEADAAARDGQLVRAQGLLRQLADDYKGTTYASQALYQAAIYAERRGQEYYKDAYNLLEDLIKNEEKINPGGRGELVFQARLKQGNLRRALNDFSGARYIYEALVENYKYPEHPEGFVAELARADCYAAQGESDASQAESAATIYGRLLDQPSAPIALRVEAGYKYGHILLARGNPSRAETIWWQMVNDFLLDDARAAKLNETGDGRYWMSRTLLKLGEVLEGQSKVAQAREVYQLVVSKGLRGAAIAQDRINRTAK